MYLWSNGIKCHWHDETNQWSTSLVFFGKDQEDTNILESNMDLTITFNDLGDAVRTLKFIAESMGIKWHTPTLYFDDQSDPHMKSG
jgi:hypothetical protein